MKKISAEINIFHKWPLFLLGCLFVCAVGGNSLAQGRKEDYDRAGTVKNAMEKFIFNAPDSFHWIDKDKFWYWNKTAKGTELIVIDAGQKKRSATSDQAAIAERLSESGNAAPPAVRATGSKVNLQDMAPVRSPDGKWQAFIRNSNVFIRSLADTLSVFQLSLDGSPGEYYAPDLKWSPDSRKLAGFKIRPNEPHPVYLIESSPEDQLQPRLHTRNYLKPGDALPEYTPALFSITEKKQVPVTGLFIGRQFSLSPLVWRKDSKCFTFEYNQRGHQLYQVIAVDAGTGNMQPLITEESKTFVEYRGKHYRYDLEDSQEIIWASERDGWNHLYLFDARTGKIRNQITKGDWVVRGVIQVNEAERSIIFEASGREKDRDPYLIQYLKVNLDGSGLQVLTPEDGNHLAFFSPGYRYFVDTYSKIDQPPVSVLRDATDGKILMQIEKADIKALTATGWRAPEVFSAKGRDGATAIWGIIVRPIHFDEKKKYPVIEYIYAGPQNSFVPKDFISEPKGGDYRPWTALHELAELGFIVVQIDGMGTSNRSKAFHDVCWKNLKDAGFPDRIRWITEASRKYPYMDISRVGIYGNSAGGQNSVAALLFHPEFYKVAVSSSGCHDNRMDKMGWNELWMGYPVGPQYEASSNVTNAHQLKGRLLLILGEMDTNVPPESTLQLVNALIKSDKDFDFLMVPGMGHSLGGDYGEHKRRDFFVKNLLGVSPPTWATQEAP